MYVLIERYNKKVPDAPAKTRVRFMRENCPPFMLRLSDSFHTLDSFLLNFANSTNPVEFIQSDAVLAELNTEPEEIERLHMDLVSDFDIVTGESPIGQLGINVNPEIQRREDSLSKEEREQRAALFRINCCCFVVQSRETFFKTRFALPQNTKESEFLEDFTERTVIEVQSLEEILILLFPRLIALLLADELRPVKKCPVCGRFFIPIKNKSQGTCSDECKKAATKEPFYKAYRNVYLQIKRELPPELETIYTEWLDWASEVLKTAATEYSTPRDFQKAIRGEWNKRKKGCI